MFIFHSSGVTPHWQCTTYLTEDPSVILKAEAQGADSPSMAPGQESNRGPNLRQVVSFTT